MDERAVLTTGANSGIGLATVIEVARRGFRSIGSVRSEVKAKSVHQAAEDAGVEVETVLLDVSDAAACEEVMADLELFGLVNNAGYAVTGAIEDVGDEEAHALFETMVHAPMRLARLALPAMRAAGGGRIINISSITGRTTAPFAGHYAGAKHALEALSDALRIEVAGDNVPRRTWSSRAASRPASGRSSSGHQHSGRPAGRATSTRTVGRCRARSCSRG